MCSTYFTNRFYLSENQLTVDQSLGFYKVQDEFLVSSDVCCDVAKEQNITSFVPSDMKMCIYAGKDTKGQ